MGVSLEEVYKKHGVRPAGDVGEGWVPLVDRLITKLIALGWDKDLHQVKEKFGGLRFYIGYAKQQIFDAIDEAEAESFRTCEWCGKPGKRGEWGQYWILTLCPECGERRRAGARE